METLAVVSLLLQLAGVQSPARPGIGLAPVVSDGAARTASAVLPAGQEAVPPGAHPAPATRSAERRVAPAPVAQDPPQELQPIGEPPRQDRSFDPDFAGWSTEPAMAYGGLMIASADRAGSRLLGFTTAARTHPGVAAAWEFPVGAFLTIVNHEFNGHGGRAREFDLQPSFGFDVAGLGGWTSTARAPKRVQDATVVVAGGTESNTVLAHRLLTDFVRPDGAEASVLPMALVAKLDLTFYVLTMPRPTAAGAADFRSAYESGNDIANYLVARQGHRDGVSLDVIWNQVAPIDFADPMLAKNEDAARAAAIWQALDPLLIGSTFQYARQHLAKGSVRARAAMIELGGAVGLTAGTRAFLAPSYVTRYLDLYVRVPIGVVSAYGRDLDSSVARTWGWGGSFSFSPPGSRISASIQGDSWKEPQSKELGAGGQHRWNASGEIRVSIERHVGLAITVGHKTEGFVPGRPVTEGTYVGAGGMVSFW